MYKSNICCKWNVKGRRRFSCAHCDRPPTCESCWAYWEVTYFFANRKKQYDPLSGDVPLSDSNLPDFGNGLREKCAKSEEDYLEILKIIDNVRFQNILNQNAIEKLPDKLKKEITKWWKLVQ